jgi:hypothetical protein
MMDARWVRRLAVLVGSLCLAAITLRFTPHAFSTGLPENPGDPAFTLWTVDWVWHALTHDPQQLFNAPIFAPRPYGLTWSDPLLAIAPVYGVFRTLGAGRILAWNLTELSLVTMTISATYALTRRLTQRTDTACVAGAVIGCSGFISVHQPHLQLLTLGLFPLAMWLLLVAWDERRWYSIALSGMAIGSLMTTALYFAAVTPMVLGIMTAVHWTQHRHRLDRQWWVVNALIAAVTTVITAPVAVIYLRAARLPGTATRSRISDSSFRPVDLVVPKPGTFWSSAMQSIGASNLRWERTFSIGLLGLALATVGLVVWLRARASHVSRDLVAVVAGALVAVVLSLGPKVAGLPGPVALMEHVIPGLEDVRVTARLAAPGLVVLAILAGIGLSWLTRSLSVRVLVVVTAIAVVLIMAENIGPVHRVRVATNPAVNEALAKRPRGTVLELPFIDPTVDGTGWAFVEAPRMVAARVDNHPRVNGYSGGFPTDYVTTARAMTDPTSTDGRRRLAEIAVRYVIVHGGPTRTASHYSLAEAAQLAGDLGAATAYGDDWLVELAMPNP